MKSTKRLALASKKARRRSAAYKLGGGKSKYAVKHAQQTRGTFSPLSPFEWGFAPDMPPPPAPREPRGHFDQPRAAPLRPTPPPGLARDSRPATAYRTR